MVVLNLATVFYAALLGPALEFIFTGNLDNLLRHEGELRPVWRLFPSRLLETVEDFEPEVGIWVLPGLIVAVALIKGLAQTGQFLPLTHPTPFIGRFQESANMECMQIPQMGGNQISQGFAYYLFCFVAKHTFRTRTERANRLDCINGNNRLVDKLNKSLQFLHAEML